jgi:hypothetical protein
VIGNVFRPGPQGLSSAYAFYSENTPTNSRIFIKDTIAPRVSNIESKYRALTQIFSGPTPIAASKTLDYVSVTAGARPWSRNADDKRIIAGVRDRTLRLRDKVGTWPSFSVNTRSVSIAVDPISEAELDAALPAFER